MAPAPSLRGLLLAALASTAAAIPFLAPRADSCPADAGDVTCPSGLPGDFCCASGSTCISLAGDTTALCCPEGSSCNKIETVACNVKLQDVATYPGAVLKTTALDVELGKCGSANCCPFGYSCSDDQYCVKDEDQSAKPGEKASTSSGSPTSTKAPDSTKTKDASSETTAAKTPEEAGTPGAGTAVAVVVGVVGLGIIAVLVFFWYRRRKRTAAESAAEAAAAEKGDDGSNRPPTGGSGFSRQISNPVMAGGAPVRNDFLSQRGAGGPDAAQKLPGDRNDRITTLFARDSTMTDVNAGIPDEPRPPMPNGPTGPNGSNAAYHNNGRNDNDYDDDDEDEEEGEEDEEDEEGDYDDEDEDEDDDDGQDQRVNPYRPYGDPNNNNGPPQQQQQQRGSNNPNSRYQQPSGNWNDRPESGESINVFADPNTVNNDRRQTEFDPYDRRFTTATMFTDMMEEVGLDDPRKGGQYVPPMPSNNPAAARGYGNNLMPPTGRR